MKLYIRFISVFLCAFQFAHSQDVAKFTHVEIDTVLTGDFSIRALLIDGSTLYFGADKSRVGVINVATKDYKELKYETDNLEFRSIAQTRDYVFALNAGSPVVLTRMDKNGGNYKVVYDDFNPDAFYNSMQFWNDYEGIAVGDPLNGCMAIIITRNGGRSWRRMPCFLLPPAEEGEGAFAASNTNIVIKGDRTWIFTGGTVSRVLYSPDKGNKWYLDNMPIVSGEATTGIYSADFYDYKYGFVTGGDYTKPDFNNQNKALTTDGGKTWKLVADGSGFGYASCVQFVPRTDGRELVTVGPSGLQYSSDYGATWTQLLADPDLYTIRFHSNRIAYAAGKNKIIKIIFKQ